MLSTVTTAELQFRHETAERRREHALLSAIRARNEALAAAESQHWHRAVARASRAVRIAPRTVAWPRRIVAHVDPAECGVCVAA